MGPIYSRGSRPGTLKTEENAEAACTVASRTSTRLIDSGFKMEHWSYFVFVFGTCCCALCVLFLFSIWGPHGKELLNSFLCELPLCPCKVLFLSKCCKLHFHYAPSHLIYCKNIKRLFPSGTANEVLIIADIFLRCKKKFKIK